MAASVLLFVGSMVIFLWSIAQLAATRSVAGERITRVLYRRKES